MVADTLALGGKVAIVTGSGRENGLGAAIATALARNGAAVIINYVSESTEPRAQRVAESIRSTGGKAAIVAADVSTPAGAETLVQGTFQAFGGDHIDILVNNAAIGSINGTLTTSDDEIQRIFAVNVFGTIYLTRSVIPHMPAGGRIINISSIASKMGLAIAPTYSAAKAAVDSLTYAWAQEFGKSNGITVNVVAPGPVKTDMTAGHDETDPMFKPMLDAARAAERFGTTEDVADIVLLLASERSRWITGQYVSASGGVTVG